MPNRFNASPQINHGQKPLSGGYSSGIQSSDTVPSVGIEDIDSAFFTLFDKELPISVSSSSDSTEGSKKVPVVFAGGEKWALLKKNKPLRDKNNALILPIITIGRTNFSQNSSEDIAGRGINQRTGEILIRRRLDPADRLYQNIVNKIGLKDQDGVASSTNDTGNFRTKNFGSVVKHPNIRNGEFLISHRRRNIYETLVVPSPQFITLTYDVIVWTQYTHHMNQIFECLFSSYLPQVQGWKLETPKGYWFVAIVEDGSYSQENNFDDMSQGERLIKQRFSVKVQGYIFASSSPGVPIPVKKYISSPEISFQVGVPDIEIDSLDNLVSDPFLGSDDPTLPLDLSRKNTRVDMRDVRPSHDQDPALKSLPRGKNPDLYKKLSDGRYVKIKNENTKMGETTYSSLGGIDDISKITLKE